MHNLEEIRHYIIMGDLDAFGNSGRTENGVSSCLFVSFAFKVQNLPARIIYNYRRALRFFNSRHFSPRPGSSFFSIALEISPIP